MVKSYQIFFSVILAVLIITFAAKISLSFRGIYYYDIEMLNISKDVNMDKKAIKADYNAIIDYINGESEELCMPDFKISQNGRNHFEDVKKLYRNINIMFWISFIISAIGIIVFGRNKLYGYLKYSAGILIAIPAVLSIFSFIDFNLLFTLFHKISFSNDLWLFDPEEDPVINILPEKYFMHEALFIFLIMITAALLMLFIYKKFKKEKNTILT